MFMFSLMARYFGYNRPMTINTIHGAVVRAEQSCPSLLSWYLKY